MNLNIFCFKPSRKYMSKAINKNTWQKYRILCRMRSEKGRTTFSRKSFERAQLTFTCSESTIETLEKGAKYGQSSEWKHQNDVIDVVQVFLLTLNMFHHFLVFLLLPLNKLMVVKRHIKYPMNHLWWSFFVKIFNCLSR